MHIIEKISFLDQIENKQPFLSKNISFSVFSPDNNILNIHEIRELYFQNKSRLISDYIRFKPIRILEHKIIIFLTLKVKISDLESDLETKFNMLKRIITRNQTFLESNPTEREIEQMVILTINKQINLKYFIALKEFDLDLRKTITINGPIASGKSLFETYFATNISDYLKINGDRYKIILNPEYKHEQSPKKIKYFSQLTQHEINLISFEIITKLLNQIKTTNKGPNVYIDKSFASNELIEFASFGGGSLDGYLIYTNVEEALQRAEKRGEHSKRYEDTLGILNSHSNIASKLVNTMIMHQGKNITYHIYFNFFNSSDPLVIDNPTNSSSFSHPEIATINFLDKKIITYNSVEFCSFLNKSKLNVEQSLLNSELRFSEFNYCQEFTNQLLAQEFNFEEASLGIVK